MREGMLFIYLFTEENYVKIKLIRDSDSMRKLEIFEERVASVHNVFIESLYSFR